MQTLLSGGEYKSVNFGLTSAAEKVTTQINKEREELNSIVAKTESLYKDIDNRNRTVSELRVEMAQLEDNISYRKKRIVYWKEQLKSDA